MKNYLLSALAIVVLGSLAFVFTPQQDAAAHCQVPCGIYDDHARINAMLEDTTTITKAIDQIKELSGKRDALSLNQATRWINTKEQHASHIITIVSEYFLTQKVKEVAAGADGYDKYLRSLATHHSVLRAAMKTKQTVDPAAAAALNKAVNQLHDLYHQ